MHRVATILFVLISVLMMVFGVTALLFSLGIGDYLPGLSPQAVASITGRSRQQLIADEPATVELLRAAARVLSMGFLVWGVTSLVTVLVPFRGRARWSWFLLWTYPLFFGGLTAHELSLGEAGFVILPLVLLILSVVSLLSCYSAFTGLADQQAQEPA